MLKSKNWMYLTKRIIMISLKTQWAFALSQFLWWYYLPAGCTSASFSQIRPTLSLYSIKIFQNYTPNHVFTLTTFLKVGFPSNTLNFQSDKQNIVPCIQKECSTFKRNAQHSNVDLGVSEKRQGWPVKFSNLQRIYCQCEQVKQENLSWDKFQWKKEIRARATTMGEEKKKTNKQASRIGVGNFWITPWHQ